MAPNAPVFEAGGLVSLKLLELAAKLCEKEASLRGVEQTPLPYRAANPWNRFTFASNRHDGSVASGRLGCEAGERSVAWGS